MEFSFSKVWTNEYRQLERNSAGNLVVWDGYFDRDCGEPAGTSGPWKASASGPPILQNAGGVTWTAEVGEKKSGNGAVLVWSFFICVS
jgi:hypothetical protein